MSADVRIDQAIEVWKKLAALDVDIEALKKRILCCMDLLLTGKASFDGFPDKDCELYSIHLELSLISDSWREFHARLLGEQVLVPPSEGCRR